MLSIGEFSKISKVTTKTLRYYDEIGLLRPAHVNGATGYRYYDVEQLKTVLLIGRLKLYRFSLVEIVAVLSRPGDSEYVRSILAEKSDALQGELDAYRWILRQMRQDAANLERGIDMMSYLDEIPVKLREVPSQNILSIRKRMNVADYGAYMGQLYDTLQREKLTALGPPLSIFHDEEHNPEDYDIEIAIPVREFTKGVRAFEGGLCAMVELLGPYTELPSIYAKIKQWMEAEGYELGGAPFEIYLTNPAETPPDENKTEVYCPVRR